MTDNKYGKPYPGSPEYTVTTDGRVFRATFRNGTTSRVLDIPREIKRRIGTAGYWIVGIMIGGRQKTVFCHKLVLETYVGPRPSGCQCAHMNGRRDDCRLENLKWVTGSENMRHQRGHGTALVGSRNHNARFDDISALSVKLARMAGVPAKKLAEIHGVSYECIWSIAKGRNWAHLNDGACVLALLRAQGVAV